ncbi:MAG TPA: hypothetical protein EYP56_15035 [Planctomycetaceae bacterium]|nr:hypothetical protein [Planctomycetaceae bacterium]HIQ21597.1 hypothetical protein [Planctomycetota bacterium]
MRVIVTGLVVLATGVGLAWGQDYYYPSYADFRASTPAEGYARGIGNVIRSQGAYNLLTSQAAINMTEAQREHMKNREQWTNTYFEMRAANKAYRAAARRPRPTMEDAVRWAQAGKPARLSPSELDVVTGKINWPRLLATERYTKYRQVLEALFAHRAVAGTLSYERHAKLEATTDAMLEELKSQIREVRAADYTASRRFLESLAYEASLPVVQ